MNLAELGDVLDAASYVLRVETLDEYRSSSDVDWPAAYLRGDPAPDPSMKQGWLDRLSRAAQDERSRRRLRVVSRPVPDYVRYACEWGYADNVRAGEIVRIVDEAHAPDVSTLLRGLGDFYVVDSDVYRMHYENGTFGHAYRATMPERFVRAAVETFDWAIPFDDWWSTNLDLHRD